MTMLYKYYTEDRIDIIENMAVRFSPLKSLNDPFESMPLIGIMNTAGKDMNERLDEARLEIEKYWNDSDKTDEVRKEVDDSLMELEEIKKKATEPGSIGRQVIGLLADDFGVLCLSRTNRNLLMWSHYANNGKGYVIALDDEHPFFHQEGLGGNSNAPIPVVYSSSRRIVDSQDEMFYEKLLCRKSIDWSYEEEERIFYSFASSCEVIGVDDYGQKIILSDLPSSAIRAVYIGYNASDKTTSKIQSAIRKNNIDCLVYRAHISPSEYRIIFNKI